MHTEIIEHRIDARHLTSFQVPEFRKDLVAIARKGPRGILLDVSTVESMDSASLGVIVLLARLLPAPARVCLWGARPEISTLCEVVRIHSVIGITATREEALQNIEEYLARKAKLAPPFSCAN